MSAVDEAREALRKRLGGILDDKWYLSGQVMRAVDEYVAAVRAVSEPQWEACKVCGGDHWTHDHDAPHVRRRAVSAVDEARAALLEWVRRVEVVDDPAGNTIYDELRLNLLPALIAAVRAEGRELVDNFIFDLPIGNDVTYSRGYSAGVAAARESLRAALERKP